jgi:hypothetical protein
VGIAESAMPLAHGQLMTTGTPMAKLPTGMVITSLAAVLPLAEVLSLIVMFPAEPTTTGMIRHKVPFEALITLAAVTLSAD